jgi:DNA-binding NtrC family response regulator
MKIFLVDDEPSIRLGLGDALEAAGFDVSIAKDGTTAWARLESEPFDVVVTDIRMPGMNGKDLLERGIAQWPSTAFILMTGFGSVDDAVEVVKAGAHDYMTKPFDTAMLITRIRRIEEQRHLEARLREAEARAARTGPSLKAIIGQHPATMHLKDRIATFAQSDATVLITGETGTGKELVARALHEASPRWEGPFIAINSSAFPATLIDAELFGHEKGAFTGAVRRRAGRFQTANGGTIFLDEIGELPLPAQAKLLRVLQDSVLTPVGSDEDIEVDVRVVAATNRDLKKRIAAGGFREDLYYRLNVLGVNVPPLRDRKSDLPALCRHFLDQLTGGERNIDIAPAAWAHLSQYPFPGNIRELRHAIEHGVILCRGQLIEPHHWPDDIARHQGGGQQTARPTPSHSTLADAVTAFEFDIIQHTLRMTGGRKAEAAERLGISRKNLWEKLKRRTSHDGETDSD